MRRVFKVSLWSIIVFLAMGAGLLGAAHLLTLDMCGNRVVAEIRSPDGRHKAVEFERDCGATTDFSTQVSVIKSNKQLGSDSVGNAFTADSNHGSVTVHGAGVMELDVRWLNSNTLQIEYPAGARVFSRNSKVGDVSIQYTTD
jgi:hypothetical protein